MKNSLLTTAKSATLRLALPCILVISVLSSNLTVTISPLGKVKVLSILLPKRLISNAKRPSKVNSSTPIKPLAALALAAYLPF